MSRPMLLIWLLAAVALFGLPVSFMDAALLRARSALEEQQAVLAPLRRQAAEVRELEAQVAVRRDALVAVRQRLIGAGAFATIQGELTAAAKVSGVSLGSLVLEGPAAVEDLPDVVRYQATVAVAGERNQYLAFLRRLEEHRLLIELPDLRLRLQAPAARGAAPLVEQVLELGFYALSPGAKP